MAKNNIVSWDVITNFVVDAFKGYGIPEEMQKFARTCCWSPTSAASSPTA